LIMFLFLSSSAFGLHWRQNEFGIALGLGTCAAVELVNVTLMTHMSPAAGQVLSLVHSLSFNGSLLIWLGYLLAPPERPANTLDVPKAQLEQWNQAVMELINR
jgi:Na+/proline symporter